MAESTNPSVPRGLTGSAVALSFTAFAVLAGVVTGSLTAAVAAPTHTVAAVSGGTAPAVHPYVICGVRCTL